jgi:hypothetical protein
MATRPIPFLFAIALVATLVPANPALAAELDAKGEADAKEATRLYKEGSYADAAKIFARLTVDYRDMPIFERSLGACFYYLGKPEPALSNLRNYLNHRKDIPADDKAVVDRWIDEMEKLRAQNAAAAAVPVPVPAAVPESATATTTTTAAPGLDLTAQPGPAPSESPPIYKKWWFWTGVGAVVVAGTVTAIVLANRSSSACDSGFVCLGVK